MSKSAAMALVDEFEAESLTDWDPVPETIEGLDGSPGIHLERSPNDDLECGIWVCTPGHWRCHVTRDEFCHFLSGRCTYRQDTGEIVEIGPDTSAFFPKGWRGTCRVHETVRKIYIIP